MVRREYTQTVQPVSRVPEKIFGWLAWISLLAIAGFLVYSLLMTINDPNFTTEFERQLNENAQMSDFRDIMTQNNLTAADMTDLMGQAGWWIAAYFALPLILGLIGLVSMKKRILAGVMMLLAALTSLPLFVFFWIPLFFMIAAILLFARKDKVVRNESYDERTYDRTAAPVYVDRDERIDRERDDYTYNPDRPVQSERSETNYRTETKTYTDNEEPRETVIEEKEADAYYANPKDTTYTTEEKTIVDDRGDRVTEYTDSEVKGDYDRDRVKYVDRTIDATEERRKNYNDRMNRNNDEL